MASTIPPSNNIDLSSEQMQAILLPAMKKLGLAPKQFSIPSIKAYNSKDQYDPALFDSVELKLDAQGFPCLYAKKAISRGQLLTFIPIDYVQSPGHPAVIDVQTMKPLTDNKLRAIEKKLYISRKNWSAGGFRYESSARRTDHPGFLGQFVDDRAFRSEIVPIADRHILALDKMITGCQKDAEGRIGIHPEMTSCVIDFNVEYGKILHDKVNVTFVALHDVPLMEVISLRDIDMGEPIVNERHVASILGHQNLRIADVVYAIVSHPDYIPSAQNKLIQLGLIPAPEAPTSIGDSFSSMYLADEGDEEVAAQVPTDPAAVVDTATSSAPIEPKAFTE